MTTKRVRPWQHGTIGGYTNHGCRCDDCRDANRMHQREYLRSHPEQLEKHRERERERYRAK